MVRVFFAALLMVVSCASGGIADDALYELRIYHCEPGKLEALNRRFKNHTMQLFEKHGMENVAYWTPVDESDERLIYVLRHKDAAAAKVSWEGFRSDPEWKQVAAKSLETDGKILSGPVESTFMTATDYSPEVQPANADRLYQLRIYKTNDGRFDALNARFRDHTVRLFSRHGMNSYGYWTPTDENPVNTLIYFLDFADEEAAKAGFKSFGQDSEWIKARTASEADGKILSEPPQATYLRLTEYSPRAK